MLLVVAGEVIRGIPRRCQEFPDGFDVHAELRVDLRDLSHRLAFSNGAGGEHELALQIA